MSKLYLITPETFQDYEDISINVKDKRLLVCVKQAQDLDLCTWMADAFYYAFLAEFVVDSVTGYATLPDSASQTSRDLWNGCSHTNKSGHTVRYEGLQSVLVYFALSRFIELDAVRYTATGPVTKNHDQGEALSLSDTVKLVQQKRSIANAHIAKAETFLWDNMAAYPLWRYSQRNASQRQAGPRISAIDKQKYNYPGSGLYGRNAYGYDNDLYN